MSDRLIELCRLRDDGAQTAEHFIICHKILLFGKFPLRKIVQQKTKKFSADF